MAILDHSSILNAHLADAPSCDSRKVAAQFFTALFCAFDLTTTKWRNSLLTFKMDKGAVLPTRHREARPLARPASGSDRKVRVVRKFMPWQTLKNVRHRTPGERLNAS
jgi:hypothetical protein